MTKVAIAEGRLAIEVQGWDRLWALKSRLEIPLEHVSGIRPVGDERVRGIRAPGTYVPGAVTAGTFHQIGKRVFWDVHDPERAVAINLHDERYTALVVEVVDPHGTIREVEQALAPANV